MNEINLVFLVDGLRYKDYKGGSKIKPLLAFRGIEATLYTGQPIEKHGIWLDYMLSEKSPFRWVQRVPGLKTVDRLMPYSYSKYFRFFIHMCSKKRCSRPVFPKTSRIPFYLLNFFDYSVKKPPTAPYAYGPFPTLFDLLRKHNLTFEYISTPFITRFSTTDNKVMKYFYKKASTKKRDLYFIKFFDVDKASHTYGPGSDENKKEVDETIRRINEIRDYFDDENVALRTLVFSDHGFLPVRHSLDLFSEIQKLDIKAGKDFIYFLDSTIARFWFMDNKSRKTIEDLMSTFPEAVELTDQLKTLYGLHGLKRRYGEQIYVAKQGYIFAPDFLRYDKPRGMHGYFPHKDLESPIVATGFKLEGKSYTFEDISPIILRMAGASDE